MLAQQPDVTAGDVETLKNELQASSRATPGAAPVTPAGAAAPPPAPTAAGSATPAPAPTPTAGGTPPPAPTGKSGLTETKDWTVGAKETPQSVQAKTVLENLGSLDNAIDKAMGELKAAGIAESSDPGSTASFFRPYLMGQGEPEKLDENGKLRPTTSGIAQLINFVRIVGATPYMRGTRSIKWIEEIQQHLPRFPKDTWRAGIVGSTLTALGQGDKASAASELLGGSGYDSPQLIMQKLQEVKNSIIPAVRASILEAEPAPRRGGREVGGPPTPKGADTKDGPANLFVGADGELHIDSPTGPLYSPKK